MQIAPETHPISRFMERKGLCVFAWVFWFLNVVFRKYLHATSCILRPFRNNYYRVRSLIVSTTCYLQTPLRKAALLASCFRFCVVWSSAKRPNTANCVCISLFVARRPLRDQRTPALASVPIAGAHLTTGFLGLNLPELFVVLLCWSQSFSPFRLFSLHPLRRQAAA